MCDVSKHQPSYPVKEFSIKADKYCKQCWGFKSDIDLTDWMSITTKFSDLVILSHTK